MARLVQELCNSRVQVEWCANSFIKCQITLRFPQTCLHLLSTAVLNNNGFPSLILIEPKALAEQGDPEL